MFNNSDIDEAAIHDRRELEAGRRCPECGDDPTQAVAVNADLRHTRYRCRCPAGHTWYCEVEKGDIQPCT